MSTKLPRALVAFSVWLWCCGNASALTNLYSTQFSVAEGYDPAYELIGQRGWMSDTASFGGNGLTTNFLGSQAAYVGIFPLDPPAEYLSVWQPINYTPSPAGGSLVRFSVLMSVLDSTTTNRDDFRWSVYNSQGQRLFTLSFYNVDLGIYYLLDGTNDFVYTGKDFTNDTAYTLGLAMDFTHNSWSAVLNGAMIVPNQPLTTVGAALNLGDVDAVWSISHTNAPGDNFMVFDNYTVTAEAVGPSVARLQSLVQTTNSQFRLRLTGPSGSRYSIDATTDLRQWSALKTNTVIDGFFDYTDTGAGNFPNRFYRGRLVR